MYHTEQEQGPKRRQYIYVGVFSFRYVDQSNVNYKRGKDKGNIYYTIATQG